MGIESRLEVEDRILAQIEANLSVFRTVIVGKARPAGFEVVYASSQITTGERMYDCFREYGVSSVEELNAIDPNIFKKRILVPNLEAGKLFGDELRDSGHKFVITPGEFFARGWAQEHYMSFWEQVIRNYSDVVCFNEGFQYSNGMVEELLISMVAGKGLRHKAGFGPLDPAVEVTRIREAIDYIDGIGCNPKKLYDIYRKISLFLPEWKEAQRRSA